MAASNANLLSLMKRVVELAMPNLRHYYRVVRKAKVVKTYASDGHYWADVQPLRNDDSVDEAEPIIPNVEIPVIWAGPKRGVICPPEIGTFCDLSYYDGDPNYPRISNFRWHDMEAPEVEIGGLIIQRQPGTHIKIDSDNNVITLTPANQSEEIGGTWTAKVVGAITVESTTSITLKTPQLTFNSPSIDYKSGGG
ncbi:MAG: baseplate assembly protein [Magnetococcales bacterium]|nr:baseplate assembly protein [Magnetococcales bacterium]